jgi:hypothetical protein
MNAIPLKGRPMACPKDQKASGNIAIRCLATEIEHLVHRPVENKWRAQSHPILLAFGALVIVIGLAFALYGSVMLLAYVTPERSDLWYAPVLSVVLIMIYGLAFYRIRKRAPLMNGMIEITIALILAWHRPLELQFSRVSTDAYRETVLVMMTAGVYLFARGLDTCQQAIRQYAQAS